MLLPLLFNDGKPVPEGLIADTLIELEQRFGAVSSETQTIRMALPPRTLTDYEGG
jgi:hypothetical protein